jgi:hypothetical protein
VEALNGAAWATAAVKAIVSNAAVVEMTVRTIF